MAEEIKLMKGNEAIARAAMVWTDISVILSLHSRKSWKHSWLKCRGKQLVWWFCRQRVK